MMTGDGPLDIPGEIPEELFCFEDLDYADVEAEVAASGFSDEALNLAGWLIHCWEQGDEPSMKLLAVRVARVLALK